MSWILTSLLPVPQCRAASVVRYVFDSLQKQHFITSVFHPAPVQPASSATHSLLLPSPVQQQLQDDAPLWLETRHRAGTRGGGASAASAHCAEERPTRPGLRTDEKSQSHTLPSQGSGCREAAVQGENGDGTERTEKRGSQKERAKRQKLGKRFPFIVLSLSRRFHVRRSCTFCRCTEQTQPLCQIWLLLLSWALCLLCRTCNLNVSD